MTITEAMVTLKKHGKLWGMVTVLIIVCLAVSSATDPQQDLIIRYTEWGTSRFSGEAVRRYETATGEITRPEEDIWSYKPVNGLGKPKRMPEGYAFHGVEIDVQGNDDVMKMVRAAVPDYTKIDCYDCGYNHNKLLVVTNNVVVARTGESRTETHSELRFLTLYSLRDSTLIFIDSVRNSTLYMGDVFFEKQGEFLYYHKLDTAFRYSVAEGTIELLPHEAARVAVPANGDVVIVCSAANDHIYLLDRDLRERSSIEASIPAGRLVTCRVVSDSEFLVGYLHYNSSSVFVMDIVLLDFKAGSITELFQCRPGEILDVEVVE